MSKENYEPIISVKSKYFIVIFSNFSYQHIFLLFKLLFPAELFCQMSNRIRRISQERSWI